MLFWISVANSNLNAQNGGLESRLDKSIDKAQSYLSDSETEIDLQTLFLYQYVQRKFDLSPISERKLADEITKNHPFYPFLTLVPGSNVSVDSTVFAKANGNIDRLTLKSIYCNDFSIPESFTDSLLHAASKGKYSLTHSLWCIQILEENSCYKTLRNSDQTKNAIVEKVYDLVAKSGFMDDIAIEAMCFLYGAGNKSMVKSEWVNIMLSHQASDGGFYRTAKNSITNSKTTVLALWCMLETKTKGKKSEPWIR